MKNRWYDMTVAETVEYLETDVRNGLTDSQIRQREKKYGKNTVYSVEKSEGSSYTSRALSNLSIILLALVSLIQAIIEREYTMLLIPLLLAVSMFIVFYAYKKSNLVLEDNAKQSIPLSKVLRNGELIYVRQDCIVPGDVFILCAGDIIPCDARIVEATDLYVIENGVKYDKHAIKKDETFVSSNTLDPEKRINMVFSLGVVGRGRGKAISVATGKSTYLAMQGEKVTINTGEKIKLLDSFEKYSSVVSLFMYSTVMALTVLSIVFGLKLGIYNSFVLALTLSVASMCEFLPMFAKIIISCGIFGAGKRRRNINSGVMIKNASKLETIKKVDCLFFHKESLYAESDIKITGCQEDSSDFLRALRGVIISRGLYGASRLNVNNEKNENVYAAEDEKIIEIAKQQGIYNKYLDEEYPAIEHKKQVFRGIGYETTTVKVSRKNILYASSGAGNVLKLCEYERVGENIQKLTSEKRRLIESMVAEKVRGGSKVIGVASKETASERGVYQSQSDIFNSMIFEGMICVSRPVISGAMEYIKQCREAGIKLIMICDDVSDANKMLGKNIGIISEDGEAVTREQLSAMSSDMIRTNIPIYNLYQGLNVPQLKYIISYIKEDCKKTVAYLGRELSHLGLITEADVGFAELLTVSEKGARKGVFAREGNLPTSAVKSKDTARGGCEALKHSADVAISKADAEGNGGFNSAVLSIIAAKGIWRNLYLMCEYLTLTFASRFILVLFSMISGLSLLTPIQLLFMGVICDLTAIMMIAFEKPEKTILKSKKKKKSNESKKMKNGFLKPSTLKQLGVYASISAFGTLVSIGIMFLVNNFTGGSADSMSTVAFIGSITFQLALIAEIITDGSIFKGKIKIYNIYPFYLGVIALVVSLSMISKTVGGAMNIVMLSGYEWIEVFIPAVLIIVIFELYKIFQNNLKKAK